MVSSPGLSSDRSPTRLLGRRYLWTLLAIAALLVLDRILVQPALLQITTDAPVLNVSGRQRMLSQRLTKAALALERSVTSEDRRRYRQELDQVLRLWSASHQRLRDRGTSGPLAGRNSAEVQAAFADLEPFYEQIRAAAARLVIQAEAVHAQLDDNLNAILQTEGAYLARMDWIVGQYEAEAKARVAWLRGMGWGLMGLSLAALLALGRFVVAPAVALIQRQWDELNLARSALEDRVAQRTQELHDANRRLARESEERQAAEDRHRRLLEQLSHVSRTNTLGEMASGLAHELNQPLGAIANYTEGCLVALDRPEPPIGEVRSALEKSLATTLRAGRVLQRIRRFVTRHEPECEPIDPARLVREVWELCQDDAQRLGIRLELALAPELPCLRGDPIQLQQVLVNLVRNAFDALNEAAPQGQDPVVIMAAEPNESSVSFRVADNGEGIPADRIAQVFDPYFSTRAQGMGMGLAISRSIVEAHQGRIHVESEPGVRTTLTFTLPADDRQ